MRPTAKPHATDIRDQAWIAEATHFTAFCQRGPHDRRRVQHDSQVEVMAAAQDLANEMGKAALVYAVTAAGRSAHVCNVYPNQPAKEANTMTTTTPQRAYSSKGNASKAARIALGEGARFTTDKGPAGWTWAPFADAAADPAVATMDALDAAERDAAMAAQADAAIFGGPAVDLVATDRAAASAPNPLVVDGVTYPNKSRAAQARRDLQARQKAAQARADAGLPPVAPKAARKPAAPKAAPAAAPSAGKRAQALADAQAGKLPTAPDFSAETHKRYRAQLQRVVDMIAAKDVRGLKAEDIKTSGSSGKALDRFRTLAVVALDAGA